MTFSAHAEECGVEVEQEIEMMTKMKTMTSLRNLKWKKIDCDVGCDACSVAAFHHDQH